MNDDREGCLSDNDIAAYAEGNIEEWERPRIEAHLSQCAHCREAVVDVFKVINDIPISNTPETIQ